MGGAYLTIGSTGSFEHDGVSALVSRSLLPGARYVSTPISVAGGARVEQ
ncbi:MAG TPA: hypothetical protein VG265_16410 [Gaiellaceae bacterium]|nr:hypothetical protein [Gaiellaceae bacterium]